MRSSHVWGIALCWVSLIILPSSGLAAPSDQVRAYLESIASLYEDLEFERALGQLSTARRQAIGIEDDVALSLWEGLLLAELIRTEEAATAFKAALFLQPEAQLPVKVSPKVSNQFESLRQAVKRTQLARGSGPDTVPPPRPEEDTPREETPPPAPQSLSGSASNPAAPSLQVTQETRQGSSLRSKAYLPAVVGGALAVAGGVSWVLSRGELSKLRDADPALSDSTSIDRAVSRGRTLQAAGIGLLGAGVIGLGLATGMYLAGAPQEQVSVRLGTDGRSALVYGRWP